MRSISIFLKTVLFSLTVTSANAEIVAWSDSSWGINNTSRLNATVDNGQLIIYNPVFEGIGPFAVSNQSDFFATTRNQNQYMEIEFNDPYIGQSDISRFFLQVSLLNITDFGVYTSDEDIYSLNTRDGNGHVWSQERTTGKHVMGVYHSSEDNFVKYYFDDVEIYHQQGFDAVDQFHMDYIHLNVFDTSINDPFIFTNFKFGNNPPSLVPIPTSMFLFFTGLIGVYSFSKRRINRM